MKRLVQEDIIESSVSPWRAQVLVVVNDKQKRRMVIDYSQTINRFTHLDAFPLPRIDDLVNKIAKYRVFSSIDLRSAYHQIKIKDAEKPYTAFEALGKLYQFKRIPFGVTNGVASFQRIIDNIITSENLEATFAYVDDVTVCGKDQQEHDRNLNKLKEAIIKYNLILNEEKSVYSVREINLLGYNISDGVIRPDPERLRPLKNMPEPFDQPSLKRIIGMFSYYSSWIKDFSNKIAPLVRTKTFPLSIEARSAIKL